MLAEWRRELAWMGLGALATGFATALCQWGVDELKKHVEKKREEAAESKRWREHIASKTGG